jgi:2-keto-4-pentenoate hydratase
MPIHAPSQIASNLRAAYRSGAINPIKDFLANGGNVADAYGVQEINTDHWLAQGRKLIGRKIGLTSLAVQKQLGVDQPDYGMLFDDMLIANDGVVSQKLLQPKLEAEIALILAQDLAASSLTEGDIESATLWIVPAIEIVDSRIRDWRISIVDTIADNASSGLFVLGDARIAPRDMDVVSARMRLYANDDCVSEGRGSACLGSPYRAALWLAQKMVDVGRPLRAGDIVMTGALGPMVAAQGGVKYRAEISALGRVGVQF